MSELPASLVTFGRRIEPSVDSGPFSTITRHRPPFLRIIRTRARGRWRTRVWLWDAIACGVVQWDSKWNEPGPWE